LVVSGLGSASAEALLDAAAVPVDLGVLGSAAKVTYRVRQRFRYTYEGPARDLEHRLVALPPQRHGDQVLRLWSLSVSAPRESTTWRRTADGAREVTVRLAEVPSQLDFDVSFVVDRRAADGPPYLPATALTGRRLLAPTPLTEPDDAVRAAAQALSGLNPIEVARGACSWVRQSIAYVSGATDVATTAAQALAGGAGVCQDHAHAMIAVCRAAGLPARYVSGHMIGEGASHAWVEVVVPDAPGFARPDLRLDGAPGGAAARAVAFDPCHDRLADLRYVTVAVGRDYHDVAPTSGRYVGEGRGTLTATQRVDVVALDLPKP
jgi:transglutaminase-like putative cysteine protease